MPRDQEIVKGKKHTPPLCVFYCVICDALPRRNGLYWILLNARWDTVEVDWCVFWLSVQQDPQSHVCWLQLYVGTCKCIFSQWQLKAAVLLFFCMIIRSLLTTFAQGFASSSILPSGPSMLQRLERGAAPHLLYRECVCCACPCLGVIE